MSMYRYLCLYDKICVITFLFVHIDVYIRIDLVKYDRYVYMCVHIDRTAGMQFGSNTDWQQC